MVTENKFIGMLRDRIEQSLGWGNSDDWTNQDFVALSDKIQEKTGVALSHVTLKRIWGKVKYDSLPNAHTLNTLSQFIGFENWRSFVNSFSIEPAVSPATPVFASSASHKSRRLKGVLYLTTIITIAIVVGAFLATKDDVPDPADFSFSSKKIISSGVPNSVVFDLDASRSPEDSVIIQQSWDKRLRARISKDQRQHTAIYYFPDFFRAKLIVQGHVVKEHDLFITSDGWLPAVAHKPVPVYFTKADAMHDGRMSLTVDQIKSRNIPFHPEPPAVVFSNVRDYGEVFTDNFIFETSLRNDFKEGSSACQKTNVYLLCECDGTAVGIPLTAKGCVSDVDLLFPGFYASGKQKDLSAFGVSFDDFVTLRLESGDGMVKVFIDGKEVYVHREPVVRAKIIGIDIVFSGTGTVDYVRLSGPKVNYQDTF